MTGKISTVFPSIDELFADGELLNAGGGEDLFSVEESMLCAPDWRRDDKAWQVPVSVVDTSEESVSRGLLSRLLGRRTEAATQPVFPLAVPKPAVPVQRILIIHQNFPSQFQHIVRHLAGREDAQVIGLGQESSSGMEGFPWFKYRLHRGLSEGIHPFARKTELAILQGQAVARSLMVLKRRGFLPDTVLVHPSWGDALFVKQIFPDCRLVLFCEWYYRLDGGDLGFDPEFPIGLNDRVGVSMWNAISLLSLDQCDAAIVPTEWQRHQFPQEYQHKIRVAHEGIDLESLVPDSAASIAVQLPPEATRLPQIKTLRAGDPVVTFVARNLEPYRGFHSFMRSLPAVLRQHPGAHVLIIGGEGKGYGVLPQDAATWREHMERQLTAPGAANLLPEGWRRRVHFLGSIPYEAYKKVLQVSAVHVYLTYPFVLSWSLLESMAIGCRIIASNTAPVREVIRDGENGELVDFFDSSALAQKIVSALYNPEKGQAQRRAAQIDANRYGIDAGVQAYLRLLGLSS